MLYYYFCLNNTLSNITLSQYSLLSIIYNMTILIQVFIDLFHYICHLGSEYIAVVFLN